MISLELPNKPSHTLSCNPPSAKIKELDFRVRLAPFDNAEHKTIKSRTTDNAMSRPVPNRSTYGELKIIHSVTEPASSFKKHK